MLNRFALVILLVLSIHTDVLSQFSQYKYNSLSNTILLNLGIGISQSETDYTKSDLGFALNGSAEYFFTTKKSLFLGLKLDAGYANLSGSNNNNSFDANVVYFGPSVNLNYQIKQLYPYISVGIKNHWYGDNTAFSYTPEIGIRYLVSEYVAINGNVSFNFLTEDDLDKFFVGGSNNDFYSVFSIGLSYAFDLSGENYIDTDGDGITDNDELKIFKTDPKKPDSDGDGLGDFDEINKYNTDPNKVDTDNDGLSDYDEIFTHNTDPNNPDTDGDGLIDGDEINRFFTDPNNSDTDGDGIIDGKDDCPNLPEDFDGFEDDDGCPDIDNDNDGILDVDDECPDEPENFNNYQDTDGCPDEIPVSHKIEENDPVIEEPKKIDPQTPKVKVAIPNEFLLEGEFVFESNSAQIQKSYYKKLNEIAEMMKSNPTYKWRVEGHLDNSGSPPERKAISIALASAVKEYLVNRGVSSKSFQVIGLSDEYPLAPNSTLQGRLKNRRVEIKRIR